MLIVAAIPGGPLCLSQVSFSSAVGLAIQNSPQVRIAQNDVIKAQANLAVMKDIFIPSVVATGGAGGTYGITPTIPTIFTVNAQSLLFSFQQKSYIKSAHSELKAADLALQEAHYQVEEDAIITYCSLDEADDVIATLGEQYSLASRLVSIVEDRASSGLDSEIDVVKARRAAAQIKLQQLQAEDNMQALRSHLSQLTGLPEKSVMTISSTIPTFSDPALPDLPRAADCSLSPGIQAADESARAKLQRAQADDHYAWRPQITFAAQYGRISPINDISQFYNLHGNYNTANIGFQIELPLLDKVRKAAAHEAIDDALRARIDFENLEHDQKENQLRLQRSIPELAIKTQIAELDYEIARDTLKSVDAQQRAAAGGTPLTPKDEVNAQIQERQSYLDVLDARLQTKKAEISMLRQTGQIEAWFHSQLRSQ
jgi:outer membrane protein TolC